MQYVLFDLLYHRGCCLLKEPLARRRELLAEVYGRLDVAEVLFSEAVVGKGKALYGNREADESGGDRRAGAR